MNIGACRRALTTRSSRPLPRIGSVLAVQVTTMSNSCRRSGSSFSVIASAPKRSASSRPRSSVRLATVIDARLARGEMRRRELDHLARADQQQPLLRRSTGRCARRASPPPRPSRSTRCRCRSACARPWPRRTCAGTGGSARGPSEPADSAARTACFIWPRICGSPSTIESRPLATRNACVTACSRGSVYRYGDSASAGHAVELLEPVRDGLRLAAVEVDLGPVARRQDRRFLRPSRRRAGRAAHRRARPARTRPARAPSSGAVVWLRPTANKDTVARIRAHGDGGCRPALQASILPDRIGPRLRKALIQVRKPPMT